MRHSRSCDFLIWQADGQVLGAEGVTWSNQTEAAMAVLIGDSKWLPMPYYLKYKDMVPN